MTLLELGTAILLISIYASFKSGRHKVSRIWAPLCWLGRNSYEIYLSHLLVILLLLQWIPSLSAIAYAPISYLLLVCLSGLLGDAISRFFSAPMNQRLRSRRWPSAPKIELTEETKV